MTRTMGKNKSSEHWTKSIFRKNQEKFHGQAKTDKGKKVVPVKPYSRKVNGKTIKVKRHKRSTPD